MKKYKNQEGITLFVTLVLMGVLLGVSASLLNITLKQYQLSGISYASEIAFQAASAGMECALYQDWVFDAFDVPGNGSDQENPVAINCMGDGDTSSEVPSGGEQSFQFLWQTTGNDFICSEISVFKYYDDGTGTSDNQVYVKGVLEKTCPEDSECTVIHARGYNVPCNEIGTGARVVEREYTQVY